MSDQAQALAAPVEPEQDPSVRAPLVLGGPSYADVTEKVAGMVERAPPKWWLPATLVAGGIASVCVLMVVYLIATGVGTWGLNSPVGWAWDITNFVFWVGIGHAGTLISAILLLLRQRWRTSINRAAEAMTIFAVACAGLFPLIHVGRFWRIYFVAPVPNHLGIWPNFRSPLLWDVFAVSTYATVSLLFWYVGMIPDLATLRDRAATRVRRVVYGLLAMGWRGGQRSWHHYEMACLLLAGLATPLVLSVHSVVSFDFAVSQLPGWHTTIFPPYFVAGAIFSGFAMVLTLLIPSRALLGLQNLITTRHLDNMCKVILATGSMVGYAYVVEFFTAWYSGNPYESFVFVQARALGPYAWAYWTMVTCNVVVPQFFWFRRFRRSPAMIFVLAGLVNVGMWFERFVIIVTSLHRDALPASWDMYHPTWVEILTLIGTFGIFVFLYLLFVRFLPMIAMYEVKTVMPEPDEPATTPPAETLPRVAGVEEVHAPVAMVAEFPGPKSLVRAAGALSEAGYRRFDAHSPYPIHALGKAMRQRRSRLGVWTLGGALFGLVAAIVLTFYPSAIDYPVITGGKPYGSWQAFVPIFFELAVLFGAFGTVIGMFVLNRLPEWYHPTLKHEPFLKVSDDRFFLVLRTDDHRYDQRSAAELLARLGGRNLALLEA